MAFTPALLRVVTRIGRSHGQLSFIVVANNSSSRWATNPVVKVAQREKIIDFPPELVAPWPFLQRNFGVTAESGNLTSNVLLNFDEWGNRVYKTNVGRSDQIMSAEDTFFRMMYTLEQRVSHPSHIYPTLP